MNSRLIRVIASGFSTSLIRNTKMHLSRLVFLLPLLVISSFVSGCGGGGGQEGTPTIGTNGGSIATSDRSAVLSFPAGALGHDAVVTLTPAIHITTLSDYDTSQGPAFDIAIAGVSGRKAKLGRATSGQIVNLTMNVVATGIVPTIWGVYLNRGDFDFPVFLEFTSDVVKKQITIHIPIQFFALTLNSDISGDFALVNLLKIGLVKQNNSQPTTSVADIGSFSYVANGGATKEGLWKKDNWAKVSNWDHSRKLEGKRIALVVPGTWSGVSENPSKFTDQLHEANFLANVGFADDSDPTPYFDVVLGITYQTTDVSPDINGQALADKIKPLIAQGAKFYLFAHSQGGLVSRWAIEKGGAKDVVMLTMLGTPNAGIPFAGLYTVAATMWTPPWAPALQAMGINWWPYYSTSDFLQKLNNTPTPGNSHYYVIAGDSTDKTAAGIAINFCGKNDNSVPLDSAIGPISIDLSKYCKGGFDKNNYIIDNVLHKDLPELLKHPKFANQLSVWIRQQNTASGKVNVN